MNSSPSATEGSSTSPVIRDGQRDRRFGKHGAKRGKLRNGTFVLPSTGERVRRQITLRSPSGFDGPARQYTYDEGLGLGLNLRREDTNIFQKSWTYCAESSTEFSKWIQSPVGKGILKCSLAYTLGSLATFSPYLANFLGHQDGKHMVATITVYFHPARSSGSMIEAAILGISAFLYAVFISVSSMAVSVYCETQLGLIELGYALILIVFCGGGLGFIGWFKQAYNAPLVSVACSLASLAIITVLTKENAVQVGVFSDDKIVQVMKMVIMGMVSTSIVSLLVWPISARTELRESMIKTTDSFGGMLTMITRGFLSGAETDLSSTTFERAQKQYKSVATQLTNNLKEAKLEHYVLGTENQYAIEARLVCCMHTLAQSIGGLRSAALTQFSLLQEPPVSSATPTGSHGFPSSQIYPIGRPISSKSDRFAVLGAIEEAPEEGSDLDAVSERPKFLTRQGTETTLSSIAMPTVRTPSEIFGRFILHLGPSMKSLAYTLSQILEELPFAEGPDYRITINEHFRSSLTEALKLYSNARAQALQELYKSKELDKTRPESIEADFEEVAASCGHFSFNLQDFASEMQNYLAILEELKEEVERPKHRSWRWLMFWRKSKSQSKSDAIDNEEQEQLIARDAGTELPKDIPDPLSTRLGYSKVEIAAKINPGTKGGVIRRKAMLMVRFLDRDDIRFAVKVGLGAALYALFAFIPGTRPTYQHYRGEWGLLSYMLVCSMTIGASNTTGWARFIGTFIGAVIACVIWVICVGNPYALAFCGWVVSLPCFYIIIAKGNGPFGRFIMLTYNLSCLYAYSLSVKDSDHDDDEGGVRPIITEIAFHRVVAVLAGCIWGLIITRVVWPISARQKFKEGLSLLWLRMGLVWKRDPLSTIVEGEPQYSYMNLREEFEFQRYVFVLDKLRSAATSEFELRGPFPSATYGRIVESTTKMLDAFHAMNVVIQKNAEASEGEALLLKYTEEERAQLCARISHLFQVMASSMKLEYPLLADNLPSTANARDRLLAKIFQFRRQMSISNRRSNEDDVPTQDDDEEELPVSIGLGLQGNGLQERLDQEITVTDLDYEILYAFILVTRQLAEEIGRVQREVELLFGVLDEELLELR
ncbi:6400fd72-2887-4d17-b4c0-db2a38c545ae [Sclerotinia trifoliorum]|uniref:6400fd72-2887-4d17-b4c0-db2a38c545ae n=1 Tax=Sclerotinia trifoliorum TaxID=28548 RepID=A0A8H2VUP4_9HELO|nr:6400fd72-2887-4d17-b4c0-db2a38c545ae [Sclerotinia trifoliorum]